MSGKPLIVIYTLMVMIALGIWVRPRLFNRQWDNPILTLLLLVALSDALGLVCILIAPPIAVIIQITWSILSTQRIARESATQISDFKQRKDDIWSTINNMKEPAPPQVISTMERLSILLEKAEPVLQATQTGEAYSNPPPGQHQPDQE